MKISFVIALLAAIVITASPVSDAPVFAQSSPPGKTYTPKPGSKERKAIMDALRKPVTNRVKKPIIFQVGSLKVRDGWAFFQGIAQNKNGSQLSDKHLWGETSALLRKQGGAWKVLHWGFATDPSVADAAKQKFPRAPKSIYP